jgi:hypothetical protein
MRFAMTRKHLFKAPLGGTGLQNGGLATLAGPLLLALALLVGLLSALIRGKGVPAANCGWPRAPLEESLFDAPDRAYARAYAQRGAQLKRTVASERYTCGRIVFLEHVAAPGS